MSSSAEPTHRHDNAADPVCGMTVDPAHGQASRRTPGPAYHFCSAGCRTKFVADPEKYLGAKAQPPSRYRRARSTPARCIREIRQIGPGACPICGMALEPEMPAADAGPNPELADMTRRFWIGFVLALPVIALDMGGHFAGRTIGRSGAVELDSIRLRHAGRAVGGLAVFRARRAIARHPQSQHVHADRDGHRRRLRLQRWSPRSRPAFSRSVPDARRGRGLFRSRQHDHRAGADRPGAGIARARSTSGAIRALLDLAPKTARRVKDDGGDEEVSLEAVNVGDGLRVHPGDKVPVDGTVLEGHSSLDKSMVTGKSMPVTKEKDARVIGGTINGCGSFVMRADKVGRDTLLAQIVQMVARRSAAARRSSGSPTRSPPGSCRR